MGLAPQLADLDGDGELDLLTGAYTGLVSWMKGEGDGAFGAPEHLLRADGEPVGLGKVYDTGSRSFSSRMDGRYADAKCVSVAPVDWDADGDVDLVLGEADGRVLLIRNEGSAKEARFASKPERIKAGRKSVWVESGYSMVSTGDLDGDGLFDLVVGGRDGSVTFWRNEGKEGEPAFAPRLELIEAAGDGASPERSADNASPHVADVDGDGQAELLVGDYRRTSEGGESTAHGYVWVLEVLRDEPAPPGEAQRR